MAIITTGLKYVQELSENRKLMEFSGKNDISLDNIGHSFETRG